MKNKNLLKLGVLVFLAISISAAALGWKNVTVVRSPLSKQAKLSVDSVLKTPSYNPDLLRRFERLCKRYDTVKQNYTIKGVLTINDLSDTTTKAGRLNFLFCKQGEDFYYLLGHTKTVNARGKYLFIDEDAKRILLSDQRRADISQIGSLAGMGEKLKSEYYNMSSNKQGSLETITLINEHHVSLKQYSVAFDTTTNAMKHIYIRLSNPENPLRKDNEKRVSVDIESWTSKAELEQYMSVFNSISEVGGKWRGINGYKGYEVVVL